jgi:hypothetical protein
MPRRARRRLEATADAWIREQCPGSGLDATTVAPAPPSSSASARFPASAPWWLAAACFVLAVAGWWPRLAGLEAGPERARAQLLASAGPGVGHWPWAHESGLPATVDGDVVWDGQRQRGYLTLTGLPPNERGTHQYQLWIFDAARDDRYPVDGGLFDVPADAQRVVVPIRAALHVSQPVAFAVTLEPAGGVVVSDRTHLVAMARTGPP